MCNELAKFAVMPPIPQHFSFLVNNVTLTCERLDIKDAEAFRVSFSSARAPIVIVRAAGIDRAVFWTSLPEGRQREAEGVGKLIDDYLRENY